MKIHKATFRCSPSQTAFVLHDVAEGRKIIVALVAVYTIVYGDKPNIVVRKIGVTDLDKTTKIMKRSC